MEVGVNFAAFAGGALAFAIGYTVHRGNAPAGRGMDLDRGVAGGHSRSR